MARRAGLGENEVPPAPQGDSGRGNIAPRRPGFRLVGSDIRVEWNDDPPKAGLVRRDEERRIEDLYEGAYEFAVRLSDAGHSPSLILQFLEKLEEKMLQTRDNSFSGVLENLGQRIWDEIIGRKPRKTNMHDKTSTLLVEQLEKKRRTDFRDELIADLKAFKYDYYSDSDAPYEKLVERLKNLGYRDLADAVNNGAYELSAAEYDEQEAEE